MRRNMSWAAALTMAVALGGCGTQATSDSQPLVEFEGVADPASNKLEISFKSPSGAFEQGVTLPYGTGSGQVYFHTVSVTYDKTNHRLVGVVEPANNMSSAVLNFTAVLEQIIGTGVTANLPHNYGTVPTGGVATGNQFNWIFSDPSDGAFSFRGHVDGTPQSAMCTADQQACTGNAQCCSTHCSASKCCEAPGANCTTAADCCVPAGSSCNAGKCCRNTGAACGTNTDCCSGTCDVGNMFTCL